MKIEQLTLGAFQTHFYIVIDEENQHCVLVDPGDGADQILEFLDTKKLIPDFIINTHGHCDHIMGINALMDKYPNLLFYIHENEMEHLQNPEINLSVMLGEKYTAKNPTHFIKDGDEVAFGSSKFRIIYTPGHTPGGCCLLLDEKHMFSGDTLFQGSVGRTDFPLSNTDQLVQSIKEKIFPLNDDIIVYPGHGPNTTIGDEKKLNPFLCHLKKGI